MNKALLTGILGLLTLLVSCSGSILNDAESIRQSKTSEERSMTTATTYTVTFDFQDGVSPTTTQRKIASPSTTIGTLPSEPTREGFQFAGWWTAPNGGGTTFDADTAVSANLTVYAKWSTAPVHAVTFVSRGGSSVSAKKAVENTTLPAPVEPRLPGYRFGGWYLEEETITPWNFESDRVTANLTLYAKWDAYAWKVAFIDPTDAESATPSLREVTSPKTSTGDFPADPVRPGYHFAGWWTGEDGTGTQFTTSTTVTGNLTVYAKWSTSAVYVVSFDAMGGSPVGAQTIEQGKSAIMPTDPEKDGYAFAGWYSAENGNGMVFSPTTKITANQTYYASWKGYSYAVTFNAPDATSNESIPAITVSTPETTVSALPAPAPRKKGYLFAGWYTEPNGNGAEFTPNTRVSADIAVYAAWVDYCYVVTFDPNIAPVSAPPASMTVTSPDTTLEALPAPPTRVGYLFDGWYVNPNDSATKITAETTIESSLTVYARWIKACTVTYSANGGSGTMDSQTVAMGETAPLSENAFTRPGFSFSGWAISPYGTCTYEDRGSFTANATSVTLYATWSINTYTISYDPNGGRGKMADITLEYNRTTTLSPNKFTRTNYKFVGWATEPGSSVSVSNLGIYTMGAKGVTFYAVWKYTKSTPDELFSWKVLKRQITITGFSDEWTSADTEILVPDFINGMPVTKIAGSAFKNHASLIAVSIPETVVAIGDEAFSGCSALTSFRIPSSVTNLGRNVFDNCTNLARVVVDSDSKYFATMDGVVFSKDHTVLYRFPAGKPDDEYAIPDAIRSVYAGAFNGNRYLDEISIPQAVNIIGDGAFAGCTGLDVVTLAAKTPPTLGKGAFDTGNAKLAIRVPKAALAAYRSAANWSAKASQIEGY